MHFKKANINIVPTGPAQQYGGQEVVTLNDFVIHYSGNGPEREKFQENYYKRAIDGMFSEILKRYPNCKEKSLGEVTRTLVRLINNGSIRNIFIAPSALAESLMFEVFGNPRSKYAYLWESIRDLVEQVANIVTYIVNGDYDIINEVKDSPILSHNEKVVIKNILGGHATDERAKNDKLEAFKLAMFVSIIGEKTFIKLVESSALAEPEWKDDIKNQAQMFSFIRWYFERNKTSEILVRDKNTGKFKEGVGVIGVLQALKYVIGGDVTLPTKMIIAIVYPNLQQNYESKRPWKFLLGVFRAILFEKGKGLKALTNNNIVMPGHPCFIRTMVSIVDSAGYAKKGALELLLGPPRSFIQADVEHATATFTTEMPFGIAPIDEDGYLRVDHVNYERIKIPLSTRYWNGKDTKENLQIFKSYEGLIIPFILTDEEWGNAVNKRVLPIKGMWDKKYKKHAINEPFCNKPCFKNNILNDFYKKNKMKYQRKYFVYFRHNEDGGLIVTGNRMYQGAQSEFDEVKKGHCLSVEQQGPLKHILNYHYTKDAPERTFKFK